MCVYMYVKDIKVKKCVCVYIYIYIYSFAHFHTVYSIDHTNIYKHTHTYIVLTIFTQHVKKRQRNQKLEKAEEPEIKLPTSVRASKKQQSSRKTSTSA